MSFVRIILSWVFVISIATAAAADTVRVVVDRALVWTSPSGISVVITQLRKDQTVEVVRRVQRIVDELNSHWLSTVVLCVGVVAVPAAM